jgi:mannose-6-phosphate isomerase-like protein (cupin superfamily)
MYLSFLRVVNNGCNLQASDAIAPYNNIGCDLFSLTKGVQNVANIITAPTIIEAAGTPPKRIEEFIGRVNSRTEALSIAMMKSPPGWSEPGQAPIFDEYTVVLKGTLHVKLRDREFDVSTGQAVVVHAGEWVQYGTPSPQGAEYIAVCLPAFSPDTVNRDGG